MLSLLAAAVSVAGAPTVVVGQQGQDGGGISVEEYLRVFPPAPVDVQAAVEGGAVVVTWSPPAPAATREGLAYDPAIAGYRVYRVDGEGGRTRIGDVDAETTRFRDPSLVSGVRRYAVTAVQRSGQESGLSHAAEAHVP